MRVSRLLAVVAVLAVASPAVDAAAQSALAGVVTVLQGPVTATRSPADPVELQLRDGVFSDERITTGASAFARILLGGKAIVTMRERSSVQIVEDLGTSTLAMSEGRIAV